LDTGNLHCFQTKKKKKLKLTHSTIKKQQISQPI